MNNFHSRNLIISGSIYTVIIFLWPVFMIISEIDSGSLEGNLEAIGKNGTLYFVNFIIASLIAPSIFVLISIVSGLYRKDKLNFYDTAGIALLVAYSVLNSISYISQYSILPKLIASRKMNEAEVWLFGNNDSLVYFFNQMGYCLFGISVIMIFKRFLNEKGINRVIGWFFYISGVLSIIAFIGLLMQNKVLNISTVFSGLLLVPVGLLTIFSGIRNTNRQRV